MNRKSGWKILRSVKWGHVSEAVGFAACMVVAVVSVGWPSAPWATVAWIGAAALGAHLGYGFLDSEGFLEEVAKDVERAIAALDVAKEGDSGEAMDAERRAERENPREDE